jgi:hypothetical protein
LNTVSDILNSLPVLNRFPNMKLIANVQMTNIKNLNLNFLTLSNVFH